MMRMWIVDTWVDEIESLMEARGWLVVLLLCWKIFFVLIAALVFAFICPPLVFDVSLSTFQLFPVKRKKPNTIFLGD